MTTPNDAAVLVELAATAIDAMLEVLFRDYPQASTISISAKSGHFLILDVFDAHGVQIAGVR